MSHSFLLEAVTKTDRGDRTGRDDGRAPNPAQCPSVNSRNLSLDALRGMAILLVLGRHFDYFTIWRRIGWTGVDLFFVLSGFLISGLLFQELKARSAINVKRFILRRGLKIWPSYYLLIGVTGAFSFVAARARGAPFAPHEILAAALFVRNFVGSDGLNLLVHSWSLAVEEHFYLLFPLLLWGLIRRRSDGLFPMLPVLCGGVIAMCLYLRISFPQNAPYPWATYLRVDGLFAGVALGYLYHFRIEWFRKLTGAHALFICVLCLSPAFIYEAEGRLMQTIGITLLVTGFSFLVAWSVVRTPGDPVTKLLARVGFYSYSIYLWHICLALPFVSLFHRSFSAFAAGILFSIVGGIGMSQLVEIPVLAIREKWSLTALNTPRRSVLTDAAVGVRPAIARPGA
jgi:peptidoglycan/LPS O-acetylase OafA/YrhL